MYRSLLTLPLATSPILDVAGVSTPDAASTAAAALAESNLDDLRENHSSEYWRTLHEHGVAPDRLADGRNLFDLGEIETIRRGLAGVDAQVGNQEQRAAPGTRPAALDVQQGGKRP